MAESENPDVVILDLGLPDISGFEVLKQIRLFSDVPVLILTVRGDETDVVKGLEWGADDYVVKPFHQLELLSRVKALLRRSADKGKDTPVARGEISLNPTACRVVVRGVEMDLTPTESRVLHCLMKNAGQVVTHSALADAIWGGDSPDAADSIKVYVRRLREKIEANPATPTVILTKSGVGYQIA
jgi:two-component system KDP operon response regulator KdpE